MTRVKARFDAGNNELSPVYKDQGTCRSRFCLLTERVQAMRYRSHNDFR